MTHFAKVQLTHDRSVPRRLWQLWKPEVMHQRFVSEVDIPLSEDQFSQFQSGLGVNEYLEHFRPIFDRLCYASSKLVRSELIRLETR